MSDRCFYEECLTGILGCSCVKARAELDARRSVVAVSQVADDCMWVGAWRYCPACGSPVANDQFGFAPRVVDGAVYSDDLTSEDQYREVVCGRCERPWIACPCDRRLDDWKGAGG